MKCVQCPLHGARNTSHGPYDHIDTGRHTYMYVHKRVPPSMFLIVIKVFKKSEWIIEQLPRVREAEGGRVRLLQEVAWQLSVARARFILLDIANGRSLVPSLYLST